MIQMPQNVGKARFIEPEWFKDYGGEVMVVGSRCEACKKVFFPKKETCPDCFEGKLREIPLSKKGRLHSYTLSFMNLPGMETPYVMGFVDLPEGIKLFSVLTDCEPYEKVLKVDIEMEMVIEKIKKDQSGNEIWGYKFRPIQKGATL
jgi:uncharacterized OB-fold protein